MKKLLIGVPTMGKSPKDVGVVGELLIKTVGPEYNKFVEVIGLKDHFLNKITRHEIIKNVNSLGQEFRRTLHVLTPPPDYTSGEMDISTKKGRYFINCCMEVAKGINADIFSFHPCCHYIGKSPSPINILYKLEEIKRNCAWAVRKWKKIALEVITDEVFVDYYCEKEEDIVHDFAESLINYLFILQGVKGLNSIFDVGHIAAAEVIKEGGIIDLITPLKILGKKVKEIHFNDISCRVEKDKKVLVEGLIPGQGMIGEQGLIEFCSYVKKHLKGIFFCVEVAVKDHDKPDEVKKSLIATQSLLEAA